MSGATFVHETIYLWRPDDVWRRSEVKIQHGIKHLISKEGGVALLSAAYVDSFEPTLVWEVREKKHNMGLIHTSRFAAAAASSLTHSLKTVKTIPIQTIIAGTAQPRFRVII